ncbi:MAG: methionyl-tRNA formyltransferase [Candidatus Paceibacterota bacterium]
MKNKKISLVFFGTSTFSVHLLEKLQKGGYIPKCIVTTPDKPQGRKLIPAPSPVKVWAHERHIPLLQPEVLDDDFISRLREKVYDVFIVASYGKIIPKEIIALPHYGILNVHPSLLPLYRGASPLQYQIRDNAEYVGVTIMLMDEKMDHGPILAQETLHMPKTEKHSVPTSRELSELLAKKGGDLLLETIPQWTEKAITPQEQDHKHASYTKRIEKKDAEISLKENPLLNYRKIRAFIPAPVAYYFHDTLRGKIRVKITDATLINGELHIKRVIPEGKQEMDYEDFLRGVQSMP